jgi:hypothetical protein
MMATGPQFALNFPPNIISLLLHWDSFYPFVVKGRTQAFLLWGMLPKFILWNLWLERNHRIFRESQKSATIVITKIQALLGESAPSSSQPSLIGSKLKEVIRRSCQKQEVDRKGQKRRNA